MTPEPYVELADRFALVPQELLYDVTIPAEAVRVYGVLRRHGLDPSNCFPSHQRIADLIGKSKRSVPAWLRSLEEAGWIERVPRLSPEGDPTSNGYRVHLIRRRAAQRGDRVPERAPLRADARGGSTPTRAPKESKGNESQKEREVPALPDGSEGRLPLGESSTERTELSVRRERAAKADALLKVWWERQSPRPTQNYIGCRKVLERLLEAGWTDAQLEQALQHTLLVSAGAMELSLRKLFGTSPPPSVQIDTDRDADEGRMVMGADGSWSVAP